MITSEDRSSISVLKMNFGRANAINGHFLDALDAALDRACQDPCRGLVLTGYDRYFSAGLDLNELSSLPHERMSAFIERFTDVFLRVFSFPKPVVAAVNGHAIAGGCILALACDYRIASEGDYRIGLNELALGISFPAVALEIARFSLSGWSFSELFHRAIPCPPEEALRARLADELAGNEELIDLAEGVCRDLALQPMVKFAERKNKAREESVERILSSRREGNLVFLDTWFSAETQSRITALRESINRKKQSAASDSS